MEKSQIINSVKYKFISLLVIVYVFINFGCSSSYWGSPMTRTEKIDTDLYSEQINIQQLPSFNSTVLSFKIQSYKLIEESTIETRYEYQRVDKTAVHWGVASVLGFVPLIIGLANIDQNWGKGVAILGAIFSYSGITQIPKNTNSESDDYKTKNKKEEVVDKKIVMSSNYKPFLERIKIVHPNGIITLSPNMNNEYVVDVMYNFGFKEFEDTLSFEIKVKTMEDKIIGDIVIRPKEFTIPYVRIQKSYVKIVNENINEIQTLGILNAGDIIPIIHAGKELFKVNHNNSDGYISTDSGHIFWAVPDYKP